MRGRRWAFWFVWVVLLASARGVESSEEEEGIEGEEVGGGEVRVLTLPEWEETDLTEFEENGRPRNLGGGLWPAEFFPLEAVPPRLKIDVEILDPNNLPEMGGPPLREIAEDLRPKYFGVRPVEGLVDPQRLVDEPYRANLLRFLKYHVEESTMTTYVLVLGPEQELPAGVSTGEVWRRWFPQGDGAIILYQMGKPNRTAIEFGSEMARKAGRARLQSILDACVKDATQTKNESAQLERFCVKYSIQAYWLERDLRDADRAEAAVVVAEREAELQRGWWARNFWAVVVVLLGAAGLGGAVWWSMRRRVVLFPELEVPMRLGGVFSGGSDAVVHFGRNAGFEEEPRVLD